MLSLPVSWVCCNLMVCVYVYENPSMHCPRLHCFFTIFTPTAFLLHVLTFPCSGFHLSSFFFAFRLSPPDIFFTREDNFPVRLRLLPPCFARSALSSQRHVFPVFTGGMDKDLFLFACECKAPAATLFVSPAAVFDFTAVMSCHTMFAFQLRPGQSPATRDANHIGLLYTASVLLFVPAACICLVVLVGWLVDTSITFFWPPVNCCASIAMLLPSCFWFSFSHFFWEILSILVSCVNWSFGSVGLLPA